jgi:hypothetical protein
MLSDLAQLVIRAKARDHHWVLPTYPGHVKLPDDLFKGLSSEEALEASDSVTHHSNILHPADRNDLDSGV